MHRADDKQASNIRIASVNQKFLPERLAGCGSPLGLALPENEAYTKKGLVVNIRLPRLNDCRTLRLVGRQGGCS